MRDARPQKPRPEGAPRPAEGKPRPPRPQKPQVERTTPGPALTMEEMIQALQAKFSGMK
jgi:hypothetical protein